MRSGGEGPLSLAFSETSFLMDILSSGLIDFLFGGSDKSQVQPRFKGEGKGGFCCDTVYIGSRTKKDYVALGSIDCKKGLTSSYELSTPLSL